MLYVVMNGAIGAAGMVLLLSLLLGFASIESTVAFQQASCSRAAPTVLRAATDEHGRRELFHQVLGAAAVGLGAPAWGRGAQVAQAAADPLIDVYFGCGCFWHVQHEFVTAEGRILGRQDASSVTARAGYAGGLAGADSGKVCYHNAKRVADYGRLGHAEVVSLTQIPASSLSAFAEEYFSLFDDKGNRPDQFGDRGPEYRNLVGVPGGADGPYAKTLRDAAKKTGDRLTFERGQGNDPDTKARSFLMDSTTFPFFVAEQYHQFHDGFAQGENYPPSYNGLANTLAQEGKLGLSDCPNGLL